MNLADTLRARAIRSKPVYGFAAGLNSCGRLPVAAAAHPASTAPRPQNPIFIMADDLGDGDLGWCGGTMLPTTNIDRLAREGIHFTECSARAPVCAPSRCVLMTGRQTGHGIMRDNIPQIGGDAESFGEGGIRQSLTGMETTVDSVLHAAGKWGLGEPGSNGTPGAWTTTIGSATSTRTTRRIATLTNSGALGKWVAFRRMPVTSRECTATFFFRDFALDFPRRYRDRPLFLCRGRQSGDADGGRA